MTLAAPRKRRWTQREYQKMADAGFFRGQRVELLRGEIIEMAPQRDVHVIAVSLTEQALSKAFGDGYWVRVQAPILLGPSDEPEPDLAVVIGSQRDYIGSNNKVDPLLVVEVSDTTLTYDRSVKLGRYARGGIREYWILNLPDRKLEVYRRPVRSGSKYNYRDFETFSPQQKVAPLAAPKHTVSVADLLP